MDRIYFDEDKTYHILHVIQSKSGIKLTEYGRYNKPFKYVRDIIISASKENVKNILDFLDTKYILIDGDLYITGSDKHYVLNCKEKQLMISEGKIIPLHPCDTFENIYKLGDESLYMLHDPNELIILKEPKEKDPCGTLSGIHNSCLICPSRKKKRVKHFTKEYQVIGSIEFKYDTFIDYNDEKKQDNEAHVQISGLENENCIQDIVDKYIWGKITH